MIKVINIINDICKGWLIIIIIIIIVILIIIIINKHNNIKYVDNNTL